MKNKILVEKVIINGIHFYNVEVTLEKSYMGAIQKNGPPADLYRNFKPGVSRSTLHIDLNDHEIVKVK